MSKMRSVFCLLLAVFCLGARAADTNSLVWHRGTGRVDADLRGMALWPLLEKVAVEAGWHIYVEPDTTNTTSAKFKNLPSGEALKRLLGSLNFALVPQTNGLPRLYVFRTVMKNATQPVLAPKPVARHVANELLVRLKPGTDADALAKLLGAKITGATTSSASTVCSSTMLPPRTRRSDSCRATATWPRWIIIIISTRRRRFRRSHPRRSRRFH
jgi:hypothetical protein